MNILFVYTSEIIAENGWINKADIIIFVVANREFLGVNISKNKTILDFCGINK